MFCSVMFYSVLSVGLIVTVASHLIRNIVEVKLIVTYDFVNQPNQPVRLLLSGTVRVRPFYFSLRDTMLL